VTGTFPVSRAAEVYVIRLRQTGLNHRGKDCLVVTSPHFWEPMSGSSDWLVLGGLAIMFKLLSTNEAENKRLIWMTKYVVGEGGGRSQNALMTARTRISLSNLKKEGGALWHSNEASNVRMINS
jgi:hypothetical protein